MGKTVKVLALTRDNRITYCSAPPDKRGHGRCNHVVHMSEGQTIEEFIEKYTYDPSRADSFVRENRDDWNYDPNWSEVISPEMIHRYFNFPEFPNLKGHCVQVEGVNEYGDKVNKLTLVFENEGQVYECDFGEVPLVNEDGTITIKGTDYTVLPVIDRHKVGYCQYYSTDGEKAISLLQRDGNIGITFTESGKCKILGKYYSMDKIVQDVNNGYSDDPKVDSIIRSLDQDVIRERFPEFGQGDWDKKMIEDFKKDEISDLSYRRIHKYEDQVKKVMEMQMRRMGVTLRKNYMADKTKPLVFYQKNNTENVIDNLTGRSNVQIADRTNPIALYSQTHKFSLVGREGFAADDCPESLRDVHESMMGITDPLDQSSGKRVGLTFFAKNVDTSRGFIQPNGKNETSLSDFVPYKDHVNPNRTSMVCSQLRQAVQLDHGEDPYLLGDASDAAWLKVSGSRMGINAKVAYMPSEGTWEDSCVVSESMARKMGYTKDYKFPYDPKAKGKVGNVVKKGDVIGGIEVRNEGTLSVKDGHMYVTSHVPFGVGDKLTNRGGAKGTAGRILPDDQMPKVFDSIEGKYVPAEVIMSPLSTGKRGNINAIMEAQQTMDKTKPIVLADGHTVEGNTNGRVFVMRLNQNASEKSSTHRYKINSSGNSDGGRFGEMDNIINSTTDIRRSQIDQFRESAANKEYLTDYLKAIGVHYVED